MGMAVLGALTIECGNALRYHRLCKGIDYYPNEPELSTLIDNDAARFPSRHPASCD